MTLSTSMPPTGRRSAAGSGNTDDGSRSNQPPPKRRRVVVRSLLVALGLVVVGALSMSWWALDRFVIDHVEINDVAAYESSVLESTGEAGGGVADGLDSTTAASDGSADAAGSTSASEVPTVTADSYQSDGVSIEISTVAPGSGADTVTYYVADVVVDDAVFAINGDYYGFRDSGIVIRNGLAYRDDGTRTGLVRYADGSMSVYEEGTTTISSSSSTVGARATAGASP